MSAKRLLWIDIKEKTDSVIRMPFIIEAVALMIIPFEELLVLPIGSVLRYINLFTIFLILCYTHNIYIGNKYTDKAIKTLFLFFILAVLSGGWSINRTFYVDRLSTYGLYFILILLLHSLKPREKEQELLLKGLYWGGIFVSFILLLDQGASANIGFRETLVLFGRSVDPNILAYSCVLAFIINLYYLLYKKDKAKLRIIFLPVLGYAVLSLGSRGAFLTGTIVSGYMLLMIKYKKNRHIKKVILIVTIIAIFGEIYTNFILNSEFGTRFTIANLTGQGELGTANRSFIWEAAIQQFMRRPILGYGNGASMYAIEEIYKFYGTHNSYLMILLEFGIIGLVVVGVWFFQLLKNCLENRQKIYLFLFISLLIFVFFVEGFSTKIFWGVQIILLTASNCDNIQNIQLNQSKGIRK